MNRKSAGGAFIWIAAGAAALSVLMVVGIILLIMVKGLGNFWPATIDELKLKDGTMVWGQMNRRELIPDYESAAYRQLYKVGNRDQGPDFIWINEKDIIKQSKPTQLITVERQEWGVIFGELLRLESPEGIIASGESAWQYLQHKMAKTKHEIEVIAVFSIASGQETPLSLAQIVRVYRPNNMNVWQKSALYLARLHEFLLGQPRESNTEGGIFPAIFGTIILIFIMTIAVVPLGVLAAVYLHEYAGDNVFVSAVHIGVNNLAGVPSIVFGIFGLAFFVYTVGGSIDALFYADKLPTPTFGTGGVLWAALTLAMLTLPVVIVSAEEGLATVPSSIRQASYALGATKFETVLHVVLPQAMPGILTGMILAMSRAAGEVAPLMLTGVVKLAPSLPVDMTAPFIHMERKFMHLGFYIFDLGFQSPNVEAAQPMVYTTSLTLMLVVLSLNLAGIIVRNRLRKRYAKIH